MEQYLWMTIGAIIVGFFVNTYWNVYQAYRAYMNNLPASDQGELVQAPPASVAAPQSPLGWLLEKGDRFLHALLMSPVSR